MKRPETDNTQSNWIDWNIYTDDKGDRYIQGARNNAPIYFPWQAGDAIAATLFRLAEKGAHLVEVMWEFASECPVLLDDSTTAFVSVLQRLCEENKYERLTLVKFAVKRSERIARLRCALSILLDESYDATENLGKALESTYDLVVKSLADLYKRTKEGGTENA